MDHRDALKRIERRGLVLCVLVVATFAAWMAGWAWLAAPGAMGVLGLAAATIGADTRAAGDWRRVGPG